MEIVQSSSSTGNGEEEKDTSMIQFRLLFIDPKKRKTQHKENEAIQFNYNIGKDVPEDVVWEMVRTAVETWKDQPYGEFFALMHHNTHMRTYTHNQP